MRRRPPFASHFLFCSSFLSTMDERWLPRASPPRPWPIHQSNSSRNQRFPSFLHSLVIYLCSYRFSAHRQTDGGFLARDRRGRGRFVDPIAAVTKQKSICIRSIILARNTPIWKIVFCHLMPFVSETPCFIIFHADMS